MFGSRGVGGLKVGEVYAAASVRTDDASFRHAESRYDRLRNTARHPIETRLGTRTDTKGFDRYDSRLSKSAQHTERQAGAIRKSLGGIARSIAYVGTAGLGFLAAKTVGVASDINESLTKNEQLFGRWANRIDRFSKRAVDSIGLSRQEALAAAGDYGTLFDTIGVGDKAASGMSVRLVKLAQDLASFNNANPTEVLEAIKSGLIGEAEPMRRFNALLSESRVEAEAFASGIAKPTKNLLEIRKATIDVEKAQRTAAAAQKEHGNGSIEYREAIIGVEAAEKKLQTAQKGSASELTEQQKVQARYNLILKDTAKAHGDYDRTSQGLANTQRRLGARITNIGERIGTWLLPKVLDAALAFDKLLKQMAKGEGTGGKVREWLGKIGDVAKEGAGQIKRVAGSFIDFAEEHPQLTKAAAALGATYIAMRGISAISRTTTVGRGLNAFTAAVAGAAVTHAAIAITRRGGILGKLAGGFLAPGSTPARPLFVKEVNPFGGGGGRGPDGVAGGKLGKIATAATAARLLPIFGTGGLAVGLVAAGYIATSMKLSRQDKRTIEDRTGSPSSDGRGAGGGAHHDITPGTVGDTRPVRRAPVGGLEETAKATTVAEGEIGKATRQVEKHFARMKNRTTDDVRDMMRATQRNAAKIRDELGDNTAAGRRALERNLNAGVRSLSRALGSGTIDTRRYMRSIEKLMDTHSGAGKTAMARNLDAAANAVRRTMKRAGGVTEEGMKLIKSLMVKELRMYGLSEKDAIASANVRTGDVAGGFRRQDYAAGGIVSPGGWVGRAGERGRDMIHAVLGRGEAVLNHLQQNVVNRVLRQAGLGGGLRDVFRATRGSKHHMATGGVAGSTIVPIPWAPGEEINARTLPIATQLHGMFGSTVSDAFDRDRSAGHQSPGHNVTGTAVDWVGGRLLDLVKWTVGHGYKTLYNTPPGTPWPGHSDHAHVEFGSGGAMAQLAQIARVIIGGRPSPLRDISQRAVDLARAGAMSRAEQLFGSSVIGAGSFAAAGGQYDKGALARLWIRAGGDPGIASLMAAIALAESGGNPAAHNPSGASGLWQILGEPFPGDVYDPLTNARMAVAKYNSQGLGAWEAYTNGNYQQYMAEGGIVFAAGGHDPMSDLPGAVEEGSDRLHDPAAGTVGSGGHLTFLGRKLTAKANRVITNLERAIGTLGNRYELKSRRFDLTEEELINEGDEDTAPSYNEPAIAHRAKELGVLVGIRDRQANKYAKMVRYLRGLQAIYTRQRGKVGAIVSRLRKRLAGLPDKGGTKEQKRARKTLTARLARYQALLGTVGERLGTVREGIRDNAFERESTEIDAAELRKELAPLGKHLAGEPGGLELPDWSAPDEGGTGGDEASLEQERGRTAAAAAEAASLRAAFGAFAGSGDIGQGGPTARDAVVNPTGTAGAGYGVGPTGALTPAGGALVGPAGPDLGQMDKAELHLHIHSVVPPSRQQAAEIGRAAASGFEQQAPAIANKETVKL